MQAAANKAFNADSLQRGICFANFTPRCKPLRRQAGSALPVNLALAFSKDHVMLGKLAEKLFKTVVQSESRNLSGISTAIFRQPIKVIAAFFVAPFLLFRIIRRAENPRRRAMAKLGLAVGLVGAYLAGTFLGTTAAALLITVKVGLIMGLAFWVGTALSVFLTVLFQLLVFNLITYGFLHMSSEEVMQHLHDISS